jgi:hypothetical protein
MLILIRNTFRWEIQFVYQNQNEKALSHSLSLGINQYSKVGKLHKHYGFFLNFSINIKEERGKESTQ